MKVTYFDESASLSEVKSYIEEWGFAVVLGRGPLDTIAAIHGDIFKRMLVRSPIEIIGIIQRNVWVQRAGFRERD